MWILNVQQTQATDQFTIENEPITSIDLMERASNTFVRQFMNLFPQPACIHIFCGPGNNGGDGLAIARLLYEKKYKVKVYALNISNRFSHDFLLNKKRLSHLSIEFLEINKDDHQIKLGKSDIIIDAIFGSGLNRSIYGIFENVIEKINIATNPVVSVDIPSGLHQDHYLNSIKIKADYTITFQFPKLSFLLPENEVYTGKWYTEEIGLDVSFLITEEIEYQTIDLNVLKPLLKKRKRCSHKGTYGHTFVVAGSYGKMGSAILCSKAALRSGCGLITAHLPKCGLAIMQSSFPEAMVLPDVLDYQIGETKNLDSYTALAIGPGIGQDEATVQAIEGYLKIEVPTVIDADALNIIAQKDDLKPFIKNKILTPHPKEFERLFGKTSNHYERLKLLKLKAQEFQCTIILKDAYTSIASYKLNCVYFNTKGNNGMATAGSGDVLTGLIAGLLAQGYNNVEAGLSGVFVHALAGDIYIKNNAPHSLIASDLIDHFGAAFNTIF